MTNTSEAKTHILNIAASIKYDENAFTVWYGNEKVLLGGIFHDSPEAQKFFSFATIYHSIVDIDSKIKYSIERAVSFADEIEFSTWKPIDPPSSNEAKSLYYVENAVFRVAVLWDLLAQLFNIKENIGKPTTKVYASQLFHDAQQGKHANAFARKVYSYMQQSENTDVEPWEGNYTFVKAIRDKMIHRNSPNITVVSNFDIELRMPAIYSLYRIAEEYRQVSCFITEYLSLILEDYKKLNSKPAGIS